MKWDQLKTIETNRLVLRKMSENDALDLFLLRSHPSSSEYTDSLPDKSIEDTRIYINKMNIGVDSNRWRIWAFGILTKKKTRVNLVLAYIQIIGIKAI